MATFDPKYASVPTAAPAPTSGQWDPRYASIAPSAQPQKAPMSPAMPDLNFGGVSSFKVYNPSTMSTVSQQVLDAAKKIKSSPYEPSDQEIAEAKKSGVLSREQAQYVIRLNGDKDPKEVLRDLVENQGYKIEWLNVEPANRYAQPTSFGDIATREAKRAFVAAPGVVAGSGIKLLGGIVDIGQELTGLGIPEKNLSNLMGVQQEQPLGERIKSAGEALQDKALDFGEIEGEGITGRGGMKFVSDVAFPVGWLVGSVGKYASKVPGIAKASEILSKSPALAKAATALGPDKIAGVAARGFGYGALGTAMTPGSDLGDIAEGGAYGAALWWTLAAGVKGIKAAPALKAKLPQAANEAAERLSSSFNKVNKADAAKFEKMTGENVGQFLVRRGITSAGEDTMGKVAQLFTKSLENADEGIGAIEGNFRFTGKKTDYLATAMDDLAKNFSQTLDEDKLAKIESLASKYKADGLTMSEINDVKRLYQNSQKFGYMAEAVSPEKVQRATNILDNIRGWQFKVAEKEGLTNLPEINKNTQAYRALLKMMEKKELGSEVNNAVGLTDWIVLTQDPAMFLGKQVGKSDWFKGKAIGAFAGDASKPQLANPDIQGIIGRNVEKQYASPSVLSRGNPSLVVRDQVALPAPSGKPTLTSPVTNVKPIFGMAPGKTEEITARSKIINPQKAAADAFVPETKLLPAPRMPEGTSVPRNDVSAQSIRETSGAKIVNPQTKAKIINAPDATAKVSEAAKSVPESFKSAMERAKTLGAQGFASGKKALAQDSEMMDVISKFEGDAKQRMELMKAWNDSWHKSNLAHETGNAAVDEVNSVFNGKPKPNTAGIIAKTADKSDEVAEVSKASPEAPKAPEFKTYQEFLDEARQKDYDRVKRGLKAAEEDPAFMKRNKAWYDFWSTKDEAYIKGRKGDGPEMKKTYIDMVRKDMKAGKLVPKEIIDQFPELKKAVGDYERYLKGWKTSFANKSTFVEESGIKGLKFKRQDGKPITEAQKKEILDSLAEFEMAHGDIKDILEKLDLTISHTSGKRPFLSEFGGLYMPGEKTITVGVKSPVAVLLGKEGDIKAFTHELTHALDDASGEMTRNPVYSIKGEYDKALMEKARSSMNTGRFGDINLTERKWLSAEEKARVQERKISLGQYWNRPNEMFARMVEQYTAMKLGEKGKIAQEAYDEYAGKIGWWPKDVFEKMAPTIEAEMKRKLHNIRNPENRQMANYLLLLIGGWAALGWSKDSEKKDKSSILKS